jgi:7-cyano-7-deazaguanine synthase
VNELVRDQGALLLVSGGQDSTVCLAWALEHYAYVETVGFDYGQRHKIELECRARILKDMPKRFPHWAKKLGPDHLLNLTTLGQLSDTALTSEVEIEISENGLPTTFVPARNLLFFVYAAAIGYRRGLKVLVGGMCETDFSGYPDCRDETLQALSHAIRLGTEADFQIETPLMWLTKAETWALAHELGGSDLVELTLEHTHTCYKGVRDKRHDWGYGCDDCPACELRAQGHAQWQKARTASAAAG